MNGTVSERTNNSDEMGRIIVLFDGPCPWCNWFVRFLLRRDRRRRIGVAPLRSAAGERLRRDYGLPSVDSVVVIREGRVLVRAAAVLETLRELGPPWPFIASALPLPRAALDRMYDAIARNRYRAFHRYKTCPLPNPQWRERYLPGSFSPIDEPPGTQ